MRRWPQIAPFRMHKKWIMMINFSRLPLKSNAGSATVGVIAALTKPRQASVKHSSSFWFQKTQNTRNKKPVLSPPLLLSLVSLSLSFFFPSSDFGGLFVFRKRCPWWFRIEVENCSLWISFVSRGEWLWRCLWRDQTSFSAWHEQPEPRAGGVSSESSRFILTTGLWLSRLRPPNAASSTARWWDIPSSTCFCGVCFGENIKQ